MSELADEIELIITHLEVVANYGPSGMMVDADKALFGLCNRLQSVADELKKTNSSPYIHDYTAAPTFAGSVPCMFDGLPEGTVTGLVCQCPKCAWH